MLAACSPTSGRSPASLRAPLADVSVRAAPIELEELAGLAGAVPLETERVRAISRRAAPGCDAARTRLRTRQVVDLRDLALAGRTHQRFDCGPHVVSGNLGAPCG